VEKEGRDLIKRDLLVTPAIDILDRKLNLKDYESFLRKVKSF